MGGGVDTEAAVASSLKILARAQNEDGTWDQKEGGSRLEVTCLALLSFLQAGYDLWDQDLPRPAYFGRFASEPAGSSPQPAYDRVLRKGISWLWSRQQSDGFVGERESPRSFRNHALATKVLSDLCGWGGDFLLRGPAERALTALIAEPLPSDVEDPEGIAWASLAFRSAALSDLAFDRVVLTSLVKSLGSPSRAISRKAAVDLLVWEHLVAWKRLPAELRKSPPSTELPSGDLRDWFWGSNALLRWGDPPFRRWNERMKAALLGIQEGDAETMAFRALTLETYYAEPWIYGVK